MNQLNIVIPIYLYSKILKMQSSALHKTLKALGHMTPGT